MNYRVQLLKIRLIKKNLNIFQTSYFFFWQLSCAKKLLNICFQIAMKISIWLVHIYAKWVGKQLVSHMLSTFGGMLSNFEMQLFFFFFLIHHTEFLVDLWYFQRRWVSGSCLQKLANFVSRCPILEFGIKKWESF